MTVATHPSRRICSRNCTLGISYIWNLIYSTQIPRKRCMCALSLGFSKKKQIYSINIFFFLNTYVAKTWKSVNLPSIWKWILGTRTRVDLELPVVVWVDSHPPLAWGGAWVHPHHQHPGWVRWWHTCRTHWKSEFYNDIKHLFLWFWSSNIKYRSLFASECNLVQVMR